MNLDKRLREGWGLDAEAFGLPKNKDKRKRIVLEDGSAKYVCTNRLGVRECGKTLGSVALIDGKPRFKILLVGTEDRSRKAKVLIERKLNSTFFGKIEIIPNAEYEQERADLAGNVQGEEWQDIEDNLGGKCPEQRCQLGHTFTYEEIAQELGFADCEDALRTLLKEGEKLSDNPCNLAVGMLQNYVHRKVWRGDIHSRRFAHRENFWQKIDDPFAEE